MRKVKINVISLGCPKNLVDTENILGMLNTTEVEFTQSSEDADVILINTCGFIDAAKEESINTILEAVSLKEKSHKKVIVTGCLVERYKQELEKEIPEVDEFIDLKNQTTIPQKLSIQVKPESKRIISTPKHLAYLKISEGCDHTCSFCAIPNIRGKHKSKPIEKLVEEAKYLADQGVKELNIVSQDTSYYGTDIYGKPMLFELLRKLEKVEGIKWIRLYYLYPTTVNEDFFKFIKDSQKVLPYIEMPIQHTQDHILKDMMRGYRKKKLYQILEWKEKYTPDMAIRSSVIVGYPTEKEKDFLSMLEFLKEAKFDWLGVFTYSHEEGTPAYEKHKDKIPKKEKLRRFNEVIKLQEDITYEKNLQTVGKEFEVIVDGFSEEWETLPIGRSYRSAYDIDGIIYIETTQPLKTGDIIKVKIKEVADKYDLVGEEV
ncbi:30S ribosomal protein S12 methylthiotransferase RimO [Sulfurihydrogenibium azorense]|uniref:30S ribosomal protein S12 methylthiotransferase RimO n=1 Tax=Sulfurihydrogenibium azorense TaxID=309806 RepID=UPI00240A2ED2|nr:30S ribosomal protein S12 methylthiotransferase RimO [Sulfurihydrogenibium azorense]MDM7273932.1 30S ribosomal protein S12 methylthiotransferase RimO [Sulfurihydrogenibium azorense]